VSKFFVKDHEMRRENETDGMRSRTDHYGMTILGDSVGANGCSPKEEAFSKTQGQFRAQKSSLKKPLTSKTT
jgi:hypothetical protein